MQTTRRILSYNTTSLIVYIYIYYIIISIRYITHYYLVYSLKHQVAVKGQNLYISKAIFTLHLYRYTQNRNSWYIINLDQEKNVEKDICLQNYFTDQFVISLKPKLKWLISQLSIDMYGLRTYLVFLFQRYYLFVMLGL